MKKLTLTSIFALLTLMIYGQKQAADVEAIIRREMADKHIPGLQVAVVQNGTIVLNKSLGLANVQDSIPVDNRSVFAINSCTKVFTGVAIMQLVEAGKLKLSDPVSKHLDSLPAQWPEVTIRQMLTHTSGFPDLLKLLDPITGGVGSLKNEEGVWKKLKTLPMEFKPGEKFSYNQTNGYLLGKLIDKYSGMPFAENFKKEQFQPLSMNSTIFGDSRDLIPHFAPTYFYRKALDGKQLAAPTLVNNYYEFPYFRRTASGLNSSAEDMASWIIALEKGKLLKKKSTLDTMWSPAAFNNGDPTPWALGWGMNKFRKKHRAVGMSGGGRAAFLVYPEDRLAVIVLTNLGGSYPEDFLEEIAGVYNKEILKADPVTLLKTTLKEIGYDKAIAFAEKERKTNPLFTPKEFELNEWAYRLLAKEQNREAANIFELITHLFPSSSNAFDSYGEALLKIGDKNNAIKMYKRSLELNPENKHGAEVLSKLLKN
ncbi:serine hydrolase [Pedobacter paludis]|uniref:Serine hydrolase n=1 Tax=Pedobacter paludis TaxID=2203212 RepID=A0A317F449_9SPHI|nr:serine hydrolase [Pedobacter paludis]PWS32639.1 serine hydrolase [Pedobacter paludis]